MKTVAYGFVNADLAKHKIIRVPRGTRLENVTTDAYGVLRAIFDGVSIEVHPSYVETKRSKRQGV
jgi:hypothetical protein